MKNKIKFILCMCIIMGGISGCGSGATQTSNPVTITPTPTPIVNSINYSDTIITPEVNEDTENTEDSNQVKDSNQIDSGNTVDNQRQDITSAAENNGSDNTDLADPDLSNVKADDYYIGDVIDRYYERFSYAVSNVDDTDDVLQEINDLLYDEETMSPKIKDWVNAEQSQTANMDYRYYSLGDIQFTSDTELYVTAKAKYKVTKQDSTEENIFIKKTFYLINIDGEYKIKDIQDVEE